MLSCRMHTTEDNRIMTTQRAQEKFCIWLGQISRMLRIEIDRRLSHGLTESRWIALLHLSKANKPITQKELAMRIGVQGPTLVRTLDWLEAEGLIERCPIAGDRRAKSIHLLNKASCNLAHIQSIVANIRTELFDGLCDDDVNACLRVFEHIANKLNSTMTHTMHDDSKKEPGLES